MKKLTKAAKKKGREVYGRDVVRNFSTSDTDFIRGGHKTFSQCPLLFQQTGQEGEKKALKPAKQLLKVQ